VSKFVRADVVPARAATPTSWGTVSSEIKPMTPMHSKLRRWPCAVEFIALASLLPDPVRPQDANPLRSYHTGAGMDRRWRGSSPTPERGACALRLDLEDFLGFVHPAEALIQLKHL
jgi:hypothetical protein